MTISIPFENTYSKLPSQLFARVTPTQASDPSLIAYNAPLAKELGISGDDDKAHLAQIFSGNQLPDAADPIAQLYAGHQFGHWNPQLGDGRAILLGDVHTSHGSFDIQLKGAGQTPYSRDGDGRAWLGPVLREYIVSEAMHALGVPTTRALAAVRTGDPVYRETALPGGVITRVASSHIRVGTFQVLAARQDLDGLKALFEYAVARHYPSAQDPLAFLKSVIDAQAQLVAKWMSFGFIHGVMNTDNCAISGETIDYGPCAFMDAFHPMQVFSSIDRQGRYAYGNQPDIIVWNMAQLATALVPLMPDTDKAVADFTAAVHAMPKQIHDHWRQAFVKKLGITSPVEADDEMIQDLLRKMAESGADFTNTFNKLEDVAQSKNEMEDPFQDWSNKWKARIENEEDPVAIMRAANPYVIPRNHQIEAMIQASVDGDDALFHALNELLSRPFTRTEAAAVFTAPPTEDQRVTATFCGT